MAPADGRSALDRILVASVFRIWTWAIWAAWTAGRAGGQELGLSELVRGLGPTALDDITGHCNLYEFGTGKEDSARHVGAMVTEP
jgi:hypothetical protein